MSIDKYRTLTAVVETKSLTRAAAELGCTQSAVSYSIDALEKELASPCSSAAAQGCGLPRRASGSMPAVRNLLSSAEQLNQTVSAIRGARIGHGAHRRVHLRRSPLAADGAEGVPA